MKHYKEHPDHPGEQVVVCFGCGDEITRNTDPPTMPEHPEGPVLVCNCSQFEKRDAAPPANWARPSGYMDYSLVLDLEHWRVTGEKRRTPGTRLPVPVLLPTITQLKDAMTEYRLREAELSKLGAQILKDAKAMYAGGVEVAVIKDALSSTPAFLFGQYLNVPGVAHRRKAVRK
jgi:hypothetical protein